MRLANLQGRACVVVGERAVDVALASDGAFDSDPQSLFAQWDDFVQWAENLDGSQGTEFDVTDLSAPVPRPAQVFAIGVNYREHADEAGYPTDSIPVTFTKFPSSIVGPDHVVELPTEFVDWEVELVVAISQRAENVSIEQAWDHIAGLTVGQDLSERVVQMVGSRPQFSLGKSFPGFGPTGPWLVTPDELDSLDDLAISCALSGETMQNSRTSRMIYSIPDLVARLSAVCPLLPGDIIFTGTPAGIGNARSPKRFIAAHEVLVSEIEGVGSLVTRFRPKEA